jgi:hypothetical protein
LFPSEFNTGLPIDKGEDGPTDNGTQSPPGIDNWLPYPEFSAASDQPIEGMACSGCMIRLYNGLRDPGAAYGGGMFFAQTTADASCHWEFDMPGWSSLSGTGTLACSNSCDTPNNSSEMSSMLRQVFVPYARFRHR